MAIWQYTFHILHKDAVEVLSEKLGYYPDDEGFDDEPFWKFKPLNRSFFFGVSNILPTNKSWSKQVDLYGNQESNCLEVLYENDNVVSVSFRVDFIKGYEDVLRGIIEFLIMNDLVIVDETWNLVPQNFEAAKSIIENAPQINTYNKLAGPPQKGAE